MINLSQQIIHEMWMRKLRSALALFCIAWGTLTVILLLALGDGFQAASKKNILNIADGAFFIVPTRTSKTYLGIPKGQPLYIKAQDVVDLPEKIPGIIHATPILVNANANVSFGTKQLQKTIYGVGPDFISLRKLNLTENSRFLSPLDVEKKQRVAIFGNKAKTELFGDNPALGKQVVINDALFTVIGLLQPTIKNVYNFYDDRIIIPYSAFTSLYGQKNINFISVLPDPKINASLSELNLRTYLAHKYHFASDDAKVLKIFNTTKMYQFFTWFFIGIKIFLVICGTLTLGVGSLGVANIMFLIVTERTKEIGLRIAVGARDWQILMQILLEALIIVGLGGLLGFVIAFITITIFQHIPLPEWLGAPVLSIPSVIVTIGILAILGLAAGYFPARKAAQLDPITALGLGS